MPDPVSETHFIGPLGSEFWQIQVDPEAVPLLARKIDWNQLGRRVLIDASEGIISWMTTSPGHGSSTDASDNIVKAAENFIKKRVKGMRDTRWKRPEDPGNIGVEPDASFYIGEKAERWYAIYWDAGKDAAEKFAERTPPDLVVEVEVTHLDVKKPTRYASLGVREMWQINYHHEEDAYQSTILDLQAQGGPREIVQSSVLPGLTADSLPKAYKLAEGGMQAELQTLLAKEFSAPLPEPTPEKDLPRGEPRM